MIIVSKLRKDEPKHDYLLDQLVADQSFIRRFGEEAISIGKEIRVAAGLDKADDDQDDQPSGQLTIGQSENWTTDPGFLKLFGDIYEYVKSLQLKPVQDLPEEYDDVLKGFSIRQSRIKNPLTDNGLFTRVIRAHGHASTKLDIQIGQAETVYTSVILNNGTKGTVF